MATIELKITNNGVSKGTVGFIAKNAASIKLGNTKPLFDGDMTRAAWLLDHDGDVITWLCTSVGERLDDYPEFKISWTWAARQALLSLIDDASDALTNEDDDKVQPTFILTKSE